MDAEFTNIDWQSPSLRFKATLGNLKKDLWVTLPAGVQKPDDDLIAGALATLAGPGLNSLKMDLNISSPIKDAIEKFSGCRLESKEESAGIDWKAGFDSHAVSFSGGFDSLAAHRLLPGSPFLVSMDFGGWFQRETDFFETFNTSIVSTDFRMEGFGRRSWMFMLVGIILLKQHLKIGRYTTGSILESSPWHYRRNIDVAFSATPLLQAFGFQQINTTVGITEIATTLLSMKYYPGTVADSLKSLAAPGTGKSLRKQLLLNILARKNKAWIDALPEFRTPDTPPLSWGDSLTDDMLTPYLIKHAGKNVADTLMSNIPDDITDIASTFTLTFYERYHTGLYNSLPRDNYRHLMNEFIDAGIFPFTERDWYEYREISRILSAYHDLKLD